MGERIISEESRNMAGSGAPNVAELLHEVQGYSGGFLGEDEFGQVDFSAAQSIAEAEQRRKETEALLDEPVGSPDKVPVKPTRKRKPPTEIPLFTFHGGSDDGDGGAPAKQTTKMEDVRTGGNRFQRQPKRRRR